MTTEGFLSHEDLHQPERIDHDKEGHARDPLEFALERQTLSQGAIATRSHHAAVGKLHLVQEENVVLAPIDAVELVRIEYDAEFFDLDGAPLQCLARSKRRLRRWDPRCWKRRETHFPCQVPISVKYRPNSGIAYALFEVLLESSSRFFYFVG